MTSALKSPRMFQIIRRRTCLIDLKLARLAHDPAHADSITDIAGYAAVLREVVTQHQQEGI